MTLHDPQDVADVLAEQWTLAATRWAADSPGETLGRAVDATCDELGIVPGDVFPVVADAAALMLDTMGDRRTVGIHVGPDAARDLLQAMDTFGENNPDDDGVQALWRTVEAAAIRLGVAGERRVFPT